MTAGQGYRYLLGSVITGDGNRDVATALTPLHPVRQVRGDRTGVLAPPRPGADVAPLSRETLVVHQTHHETGNALEALQQ